MHRIVAVLLIMMLGSGAAAVPDRSTGRAFMADSDRAMATMMAAMHVRPTGDVDRDFVTMMVPHHQGAIDMAVAQIRYGKNPRLKRIAQGIVVEQQQEIAMMRLALGQRLPPSVPAPTDGRKPIRMDRR